MNSSSSDHMEPDDGTALSTLWWGLKHYWWLVVLGAVLGALVVPWYQYQQPKQFDATALVVAAELRTTTTVLPRYATSVFDNGQVADAVAGKFGTAGDPEDVVPKEVSMVAAQDSIVMEVIGHSENPDDAVKIADLAAVTFIDELNTPGDGVGRFELQSPASAPIEATEVFRAAPYSIIVGTFGGTILGVGMVLLILVLTRPVVAGPRRLVGLPVAGLVYVPRRKRGKSGDSSRLEGATTLARNVLGRAPEMIYVLGAKRQAARTELVTWALRDALGRAPTKGALIRRVDGGAPLTRPGDPHRVPRGSSASGDERVHSRPHRRARGLFAGFPAQDHRSVRSRTCCRGHHAEDIQARPRGGRGRFSSVVDSVGRHRSLRPLSRTARLPVCREPSRPSDQRSADAEGHQPVLRLGRRTGAQRYHRAGWNPRRGFSSLLSR